MSDVVGEMRKELGEKAARSGDSKPHDGASQEFTEGFRKGSIGFGSNVAPRLFGKGSTKNPTLWYCVCGEENRSNRVAKKGGEVVCWRCGVPQSFGEDHERESGNAG